MESADIFNTLPEDPEQQLMHPENHIVEIPSFDPQDTHDARLNQIVESASLEIAARANEHSVRLRTQAEKAEESISRLCSTLSKNMALSPKKTRPNNAQNHTTPGINLVRFGTIAF